MSGLYNLVFGENQAGQALVALLNEVQPTNDGPVGDGRES